MAGTKLNILEVIAQRLHWLGHRQQLLAKNIANADTPDYQSIDLKESSFARLVARGTSAHQPVATHVRHIGGEASRQSNVRGDQDRNPYEYDPSGNAIVLEEQLIKVSETQMHFQTMTNLYRKHMAMLRMALGRNA